MESRHFRPYAANARFVRAVNPEKNARFPVADMYDVLYYDGIGAYGGFAPPARF